jgi:uncharacterized MnhB-related membrane protein
MILHVVVVAAMLVCAVQAVVTHHLLHSALWLAITSALVALEMYLLGAPEVAVIELSVGAGLVTVLFVFAINIAGEEAMSALPIVPKPLAWIMVAIFVFSFGWLTLDILWMQIPVAEPDYFKTVLWENRLLDILLQIVIIFAGVLGVLGLLSETHSSKKGSSRQEESASTLGAGEVSTEINRSRI